MSNYKLADIGSNHNELQIKQSYGKWFGIGIAMKIAIIEFMLYSNEGRHIFSACLMYLHKPFILMR